MTNKTTNLTEPLYDYLLEVSLRDSPLLKRLREETGQMKWGGMQVAPEQGQFLALLAELVGARRCLEIGTFTGYSALCVAAVLPADGKLVACDISDDYTRVARRYWKEAGLEDRIELRLGPALETLAALKSEGAGPFDFAFIDADKTGYEGYYEKVLELLRPGGLVCVDNVLWHGAVADPARDDEDTRALRAFNEKLRGDERVSLSLVPIGDGLTLARKR